MMNKIKNYDMSRRKWYIATALSCFFFPAGIIWLIVDSVIDHKSRKNKNEAILYSAIGAAIFSLFMTGYFLFAALLSGTEIKKLLLLAAVLYFPALVTALYLFVFYGVHKKRCGYMTKIYSLIELDHITSLAQMSEIIGVGEKSTAHYLRALIKMGYLIDARVDEKQGEIVLMNCPWAKQKVVCQTCGAALTVNFGQTLVCEYCGGALKVKRVREEGWVNAGDVDL